MADPKIKIKRSAVAGKIPTTDDLELGELAINTYDGKVFIEQDQGGVGVGTTIIVINPWSVGTGTNTYNTYFTAGNVGVGTTNPGSKLTVNGSVQIQQDSGSNNRLVFRGQPGSSYRWNVDNYSSSNEFRIFREDDVTAANGTVAVSISTTGTLTATKFSGDGSLLTGITATGSGVVIQNQGSNVGTASTINFSTNLTASFSSGTATISLSNNPSISGILTADQVYTSNNGNGQNVRIGDDFWLGDVNVADTTRFSGAQDSTRAFVIFGSSDAVALGRTGTGPLYYGGNFNVAGVITASSFSGNASSATYATSSGIATYATTAGVSTSVIGGIASVTSLSVSGISTFTNGPLLIGSGTSTRTASQRLQVTGGAYVSGNLGIGITNPQSILHLQTSSGDTKLIIESDADNNNETDNAFIIFRGDGGIEQSVIKNGNFTGSNDNQLIFYNSTGVAGGIIFATGTDAGYTNATERLRITPSGNIGIETANPTSKLDIQGDAKVSGVVTATTFIGALTGTATTATKLATARTFEITGDVVASSISFDGSGNVSLAATIQPNSVALGSDTTGDYVQSISGTSNQITVTSGTGESSTPSLSIPSQFTAPQDVTVTRDLQVNRNLNVTGNITIGGTSATIFSQSLNVFDPDIVLGYRTDAFGNDVSNDNTANHGGIAIASTEGTPLISLYDVGVGETNPATYKKFMWFKSGTFSGLGTDAWISNYAVGIGSTQFPSGTRLAAGAVQFTENDLAVVRNINASGVVTATTFVGSLTGTATTATNLADAANITTGTINSARLSGTYSIDISGNATTSGYATTAGIATYATSSGIASALTASASVNTTGIITAASFVKSGGTSSEFLKADGSVDSSTYLTSYTETDTLDSITTRGNTTTNGISVGVLTATSGNFSGIITSSGANVSGITTISVNSPTDAALRITQLGSGNALVVEDETNPDSTPFVINASGSVGVGTTTFSSKLNVNGDINITGASPSYRINGNKTLEATTLGATVVNSSLTSLGTLTSLTVNGTATFAGGITTVTGATLFSKQVNVSGVVTSNGYNATTGNDYKINGTSVLTSTTLGSGVTNSSLTSVGTLLSLNVSGITTLAGNINLGDNTSDDITVSGEFVSNLIPNETNSYDLGSSTQKWKDVWSAGTVNATSFSGSGTNLTGIVTSIVAGTGITISGSTGQVTINSTASGGGSSQWVTTAAGIHTLSSVGIGTTNPTSKLTVSGDGKFTGVVTATSFSGDGSLLTGIIASGSGVVIQNQGSTVGTATTINFGTNLTASFSGGVATVTATGGGGGGGGSSITRTTTRFVATEGQTSFSVTYTVGDIDVFLNGAKLDSTEYTATNGTTVVLTEGASVDDVLEFVTFSVGGGSFNELDVALFS